MKRWKIAIQHYDLHEPELRNEIIETEYEMDEDEDIKAFATYMEQNEKTMVRL